MRLADRNRVETYLRLRGMMNVTKRIRGFIRRFSGRGDTEHLLRSPANAAALRESIEQVRCGDVTRFSSEELERGLDIARRSR
jgi:hypothetical protein